MGKTKAEIKVLKNIEKVKGEWRVTHAGSWDGRRESRAILKVGKKWYMGVSACSANDTFNRKIGRVIALGRAWKAYKDKKPTPTKFVEKNFGFMW